MKVRCVRPVAISEDGISVKHYKAGETLCLKKPLASRLIVAGYVEEIDKKMTKAHGKCAEVSILKKGARP